MVLLAAYIIFFSWQKISAKPNTYLCVYITASTYCKLTILRKKKKKKKPVFLVHTCNHPSSSFIIHMQGLTQPGIYRENVSGAVLYLWDYVIRVEYDAKSWKCQAGLFLFCFLFFYFPIGDFKIKNFSCADFYFILCWQWQDRTGLRHFELKIKEFHFYCYDIW